MMPFERIHNIVIDYENGTVLINGKNVDFPVRVTVKEADGWDMSKICVSGDASLNEISPYPELIIDARAFQGMATQQGLKKLVREVMQEIPRQKQED